MTVQLSWHGLTAGAQQKHVETALEALMQAAKQPAPGAAAEETVQAGTAMLELAKMCHRLVQV